jgi:hypothetical protein
MKKFKQLLAYITSRNLVADEQLSCFITDCEITLSGKAVQSGSIVAAYIHYQAVYEIERFSDDANRVLTHFSSWLYNNDQSDTEEELEKTSFDIEPVDDHLVDIMATVDFSESIELQEQVGGEFQFGDKFYNLVPNEFSIAETFEIVGDITNG